MGRSQERAGSAAVEFAIVGPVFILMLIAMVVYGGWFWLAQSVQTTASEAARAAVGGLDEAERRILVMAVAADSRSGGLDPAKLTMDVTTEDGVMRVRAAYDVSGHPVMMLKGLLPSPPVVIERSAVIRAGGV
jgi:Flp pilus assembly protein TadG